MDVFRLRGQLVEDYSDYIHSFIRIRDERIRNEVESSLASGELWPEPLIQLNPAFAPGGTIDESVDQGVLHDECRRIFRAKKDELPDGIPIRLHKHQTEAVHAARTGGNYVLTTGTGSGKSLAYIVPIVDFVLRNGPGQGIRAIVVYPMNALANSQLGELKKFLSHGYPDGKGPVRFERYTGQESDEDRQRIMADPPDILLTNYVMLELLLTRPFERSLVNAAKGLKFLVLDELHTYRGRQGADVSLLVRRVREATEAQDLQCVGTSATLAGIGTFEERQAEVARVASQLFGAPVSPDNVIGETLRRATPEIALEDEGPVAALKTHVDDAHFVPPDDYEGFVSDPLSSWIESTFGIQRDPVSDRFERVTPRGISGPQGAAHELSELTGTAQARCIEVIQTQLLASYGCQPDPDTGFPPFAFRLHQFISRGDSVYASVEPGGTRYITTSGQRFVPGDRGRVLLPLVFCRDCGQEYYCIRVTKDQPRTAFERDLRDRLDDDQSEAGFLYHSADNPWPEDVQDVIARLPDDWLETSGEVQRIRSNRQENLPKLVRVSPTGEFGGEWLECHYMRAPFRFCLNCGVSYGFRQSSDFAKLATLGSAGRATATTTLSLSAVRFLQKEQSLDPSARKLLSFTDNRQDASLQAGHFNDFIETGLLRSALYRAVKDAGAEGLRHELLTQRVFDALGLDLSSYAPDPEIRFHPLEDTKRAVRDVLGYRLYRDLRRGWRITAPNLEQSGLLEIVYLSLDEVCKAQDVWENRHAALVGATAERRKAIAKTLLDYLRRELAIKVDYLDSNVQERIQQQSSQRLIPPWALDENELMDHAAIAYPRSRRQSDYGGNLFISPRGGFGQYLRRSATLPQFDDKLKLEDTLELINDLLEALRVAGIVQLVAEAANEDEVPGYQVLADSMVWTAGDATKAFHDPIRVPNEPKEGSLPNAFFVDFYKNVALETKGLEAREHTAQVDSDVRMEREDRFREGRLPLLYCSPTMELGVDIRDLNVVNLRNVPPTPANYAQRSGRAGRSGQPALVFTYCSTGNSHDQYFFKRSSLMVAGKVTPPRLDLTNEDLIRAHVHAVWLAETGQSLGSSLTEVLDVSGDAPSLDLQDVIKDSLDSEAAKKRARDRAGRVLERIEGELEKSDWYNDGWLDEVLSQGPLSFDRACDRWRELYRAALAERAAQDKIIVDASRPADDKKRAKRLRAEAEAQLDLLTQSENLFQSDFYSYRYFASEGFLPGYNFPRLPLSAFIPGRRRATVKDEFLSRPRFLAISEFGPRSIVYHEGSRYLINKVILPVARDELLTTAAKQCQACGYVHPMFGAANGPDLCEHCGAALGLAIRPLFRLQNVATRRREKINSDEEERLRLGYDIVSGIRFSEHGGRSAYRTASVRFDGQEMATLTYGPAATLWRINLGWSRRRDKNQLGFVLDTERGYWARNEQVAEDDQDPMSKQTARVIPFVEDRRNSLLVELGERVDEETMASIQAALKNGIQIEFELEDAELTAEPLPSRLDRRVLLFYESAEGGAGVLRRLIDDPKALSRVARRALDLCHFDPDTGEDRFRAPRAKEDCEAACYECLMSYVNQMDHKLLDRKLVRDLLISLVAAEVKASPVGLSRAEHLKRLTNQAGSELEKRWLGFLEERNRRLPSDAQKFLDQCKCRPDFLYGDSLTAVYIDGPVHQYPERRERDTQQTDCLEDLGYTVIRFEDEQTWGDVIDKFPHVFGTAT